MKTEHHKAFLEAYQPCHGAFVRYCTAIAYGKIEGMPAALPMDEVCVYHVLEVKIVNEHFYHTVH